MKQIKIILGLFLIFSEIGGINAQTTSKGIIAPKRECKIKEGGYTLASNNTKLILDSIPDLYRPFESIDHKTLRYYLKDYKLNKDTTEYAYVCTYSKGQSTFKTIESIPEKTGEEGVFIGQGKLVDPSIVLVNGIRIGMDIKDFLSLYIILDEDVTKHITQVVVSENIKGEVYTKYNFSEGILIEIEFGNYNL